MNSSLEFSQGTNAMIGIMGSGKSSILGAICFALFGTNPELQSRKLKLDDLIMNKPSPKEMAEVEVFFKIDGADYSVKRIIEKRKGTTYSELRSNGKLIEAPSTQRVNELVEKTLKVDYELFSKAIYSEQNAIDYFLTIPRGQRMRKIDELLMIDKFEKARTNTISLINKISEKKSAIESVIEKVDVSELQKTIDQIKSSLQNIISEKVQIEMGLKAVSTNRADLETELGNLYKTKENFELLKREEIRISSAIGEVSSSMQKIEETLNNQDKETLERDLNNFSDTLDKLQGLLSEKEGAYRKLSDQYSKSMAEAEVYRKEAIIRLKNELEEKLQLQRDAERLKKNVGPDSEKALEKSRLLVEKYVGEMEAMRIKIEDFGNIVDQLSSIKAKCPICESHLTDEKKIVLIKQKKMQIRNLQEDMERAVKQKQSSEQDLRGMEISINKLNRILDEIKDLDDLKSNLENAQHIYSVLDENSSKLEVEIKVTKDEMAKVNKSLQETRDYKQRIEFLLLQMRDYESKKYRISDLARQREDITRRLQALEKIVVAKDTSSAEIELRKLAGLEKELSGKIAALNQISFEREIRLKDLESTVAKSVKERDEVKKLENLIMQLKIFEKSLEQTQIQLRQEFVTLVNYSMNQLWQTLYPYQDFTGIRLNVEEGDYVLQLQSRNDWVNVEGIVSGGERSIAALTLRIAFSLVLAPNVRILFLDEPSHNMDKSALSQLASTLRERIHEFMGQVLLITHQEELEEAVTGRSYRLERDKATDGVTNILPLN